MATQPTIERPLLRYAGSKFLAYKRVIAAHMPPHSTYIEPFGGGASVILLHGYRSALYDEIFADWQRVDHHANTMQNHPRVESLWINPSAWSALHPTNKPQQLSLL